MYNLLIDKPEIGNTIIFQCQQFLNEIDMIFIIYFKKLFWLYFDFLIGDLDLDLLAAVGLSGALS